LSISVASRWSRAEIALIERHAEDNNWRAVARKVQNRSAESIRVRMAQHRRDLGLTESYCSGRENQQEYDAQAIVASQQLLAAIELAGVRP
jgi:hypothetical protein